MLLDEQGGMQCHPSLHSSLTRENSYREACKDLGLCNLAALQLQPSWNDKRELRMEVDFSTAKNKWAAFMEQEPWIRQSLESQNLGWADASSDQQFWWIVESWCCCLPQDESDSRLVSPSGLYETGADTIWNTLESDDTWLSIFGEAQTDLNVVQHL